MAIVLVLYLTLGLELQLSNELRASSCAPGTSLWGWPGLRPILSARWQIFNGVKDRGVSRADYLAIDHISL